MVKPQISARVPYFFAHKDLTISLETKSTLRVDDVLKVQDSLIPRFRKIFREQQHKDLAVIVAGELILPNAAKLARELGYILLKPGKQGIIADASCYRAA